MVSFSVTIPSESLRAVTADDYHRYVVQHIPGAFAHDGAYLATRYGDDGTVTIHGRTDDLSFIDRLHWLRNQTSTT